MEGGHRPASCICYVSFPTWGVAKHSCYFLEFSQETVRKVPEAPETRAHKAPKPSHSARLDPIHGPCSRPERRPTPFSDSFKAKLGIAPSQTAQDRRRGDAHIVGYYAPEQRANPGRSLRCLGWGYTASLLARGVVKIHNPTSPS